MNILHYSLGLPPYRSGGLTKYSVDLILEQCSNGHNVSLLYPGGINIISKKTRIKQNPNFSGITVYEIINSTPVPLLYGIKDPNSILDESYIDVTDFKCLLDKLMPQVFHIHTFMGLPKKFLDVLKERKIKIILTTHDFYGICPKVNLINERGTLCGNLSKENCAVCNIASPSTLFLRIRNLPLLSKLKRFKQQFHSHGRLKNVSLQQTSQKGEVYKFDVGMPEKFEMLREHFKMMFNMVDTIHYNSNQTKQIYIKYGIGINGTVIDITHAGINDNRRKLSFNKEMIRLGFIGSTTHYKGFNVLKSVLLKLYNNGYKNWILNVWGNDAGIDEDCKNIYYKGKFSSADLHHVYNDIDLLIVPSICYETFSLVALEALSYGTCVAVSNHVGAKDIVEKYSSKFIFSDADELYNLIVSVLENEMLLSAYNNKVINTAWDFSIKEHCNKIVELYH